MTMKEDIMIAWNEADELFQDFTGFSNEELIECRNAMKERVETIMNSLDKYFTSDEFRKFMGD